MFSLRIKGYSIHIKFVKIPVGSANQTPKELLLVLMALGALLRKQLLLEASVYSLRFLLKVQEGLAVV